MSAQDDAADQLNIIATQLQKVGGETSTLLTNVAELKTELANAGDTVTPALAAAIAKVAAQAQAVDDLVPDAPVA